MIREMCFAQIRRGAGYKEIRGLIKHLSQNAKKISHKLSERRPVTKRHHGAAEHDRKLAPPVGTSEDDPLREFAAATATMVTNHVETLIEAANEDGAAAEVMDIVDEIEAEERESKRQQLPLQRIEAALNSLKQVTIDEDTDALDALAKALGHVTQQVERLSEQIDKVRSKKKK